MKNLDEILKNREVRLFSAVSITTEREAEMRATSAILSITKAVSEFGRMLIKVSGGPAGLITCFTEVELKTQNRRKVSRPDGVICVTRGKTKWKALVEIKVGSNGLDQEQFDRYHALAKEFGFNALITISNQAALPNGYPPLKVDLRRSKSTPVIHFSWERLLSEAQLLSWQSGVSDEDQKYMLDEWIRYVSDQKARIVVAPSLGKYWNTLLSAAAADRLNTVQLDLGEFISTWYGFLRIEAFRLRALLGEQVDVRMTVKERKSPESYHARLLSETSATTKLCSSLNIPHTAGDLNLTLDLRSRHVFLRFMFHLLAIKLQKVR